MLNAQACSGRKFSVGSNTDTGTTSFANKLMSEMGDSFNAEAHGLGFTCRKGLKPESPNQDSWMVLKVDKGVDKGFSMYGVFDGHGESGHDVSNFVKESLPKLIIRDSRFKRGLSELPSVLVDSFRIQQSLICQCDQKKKLDAKLAGTTASLAVHSHGENTLTIAHVADSTVVLGRYKDSDRQELEAVKLTRDHKPNLKEERLRIEKAGGVVVFDGYANHRVYARGQRHPGLNMSRCLGDLRGHQECGMICEPEIRQHKVSPCDHVLLLCTDGVWEFLEPEEAVHLVSSVGPGNAMLASEKLAKEAWDRWMKAEGGLVVDDITVLLVFLQEDTPGAAETAVPVTAVTTYRGPPGSVAS